MDAQCSSIGLPASHNHLDCSFHFLCCYRKLHSTQGAAHCKLFNVKSVHYVLA